jgi:hypothetical protein
MTMMSAAILTRLGTNDVLLGRGTGPNANEGNKYFRAVASELLTSVEQHTSSTSSISSGLFVEATKTEISKHDLATKLVAIVHSRNGRFVRKLTKDEATIVARNLNEASSSGGGKKTKKFWKKSELSDMYVVVPHDVALSKAKQSFRHQLRVSMNDTKSIQQHHLDEKASSFIESTSKKVDSTAPSFTQMKKGASSSRNEDKLEETTSKNTQSSGNQPTLRRSPLLFGPYSKETVRMSTSLRHSSPQCSSLRAMLLTSQAEVSALSASLLQQESLELDYSMLNPRILSSSSTTTTPGHGRTTNTNTSSSTTLEKSRAVCLDPMFGAANIIISPFMMNYPHVDALKSWIDYRATALLLEEASMTFPTNQKRLSLSSPLATTVLSTTKAFMAPILDYSAAGNFYSSSPIDTAYALWRLRRESF